MSDSLITKKAIAGSLKELMRKKSLEKITVSDIVKNCGLNRQTFYYHFKDKYDLVNWIFNKEIVSALSVVSDGVDWSAALLNALNVMKREKVFYFGAVNLAEQSVFSEDLFGVVRDMLLHIVDQIPSSSADGNSGKNIAPEDRLFIAEFYAHGLVGMVIEWVKTGMKEPPEEIVGRLTRFINDSKHASTARYLKDNTGYDSPAS